MPYRNVLSLARCLAAIAMGIATVTLAAPAVADDSQDKSSLLSLSPMLRLAPEAAAGPADDTLTVHEIRGAPQLTAHHRPDGAIDQPVGAHPQRFRDEPI
jgi:hypothetical protein